VGEGEYMRGFKPFLQPFLGHTKVVTVGFVIPVVAFSFFFMHSHWWRGLFHHTHTSTAATQSPSANANVVQTGSTIFTFDKNDWRSVPGVAITIDGVQVVGVARSIVNQDGTPNQTNPPIDVNGPHIQISGDFSVKASLKNAVSGGAVFTVYGSTPVIYDEWRHESPTVRVEVTKTGVTVKVWKGTSDNPSTTQTFATNVSEDMDLTLQRSGGQLIILVNDVEAGKIKDQGIFKTNQLWFGVDGQSLSAMWTLKNLQVVPLNGGTITAVAPLALIAPHESADAFRNLLAAKSTTKIGSAIALYPLLSDPNYRALAIGQFNMWTPENEMKPQFLHPQPNVYTFGEADLLVDTALANDIAIHGHTLVFGEANPKWMEDTPVSQRQQVMTDHITTVVDHFKGKVAEWDVVNEPLADYDFFEEGSKELRNHIWYQAMGEKYIDIALKTAHTADPNAKLYINDYGLEEDGERWDAMIGLLHRLQQRGVPIDGIGFQSHVYEKGDEVNKAVLAAHIAQLAKMGLSARVSELDVHGDNATLQAAQYNDILSACLSQATCTAYSTWGFTDRYGSTTEYHAYPFEYGDDLMWDSGLRPKQAQAAVLSFLKTL